MPASGCSVRLHSDRWLCNVDCTVTTGTQVNAQEDGQGDAAGYYLRSFVFYCAERFLCADLLVCLRRLRLRPRSSSCSLA